MSTRTHTRRMDAAPPHDDPAERITLGALLSAGVHGERDVRDQIIATVSAADYMSERHTIIHDAIAGLAREADHYDATQIIAALRAAGHLDRAGGVDYLIELTEGVATAHTGPAHARRVRECAIRRRLIAEAERIGHAANNGHALDDVLTEADRLAGLVSEARQSTGAAGGLMRFGDLAAAHPHLHEPVIDGLIRAGETANIIAPSKIGKSWLSYNVALSIVTGQRLFNVFDCKPGRVLLIDNELHRPTISYRIPRVAEAMGVDLATVGDGLDVLPLRGLGVSLHDLHRYVDRIEQGEYQAIILDAWYRFIPAGISENSNADVMAMYNMLDRYAASTGAAWLVVHHTSKGGQADKSVTDVGSGAGAQSRAADTHIVLRQHEDDGCVVLDAAVRSFPPVEPIGLQWTFPTWTPAWSIDTAALKGRKTVSEQRQDERDRTDTDRIAEAMAAGPMTRRKVRDLLGCGNSRADRLLAVMESTGRATSTDTTIRGNPTREYRLASI